MFEGSTCCKKMIVCAKKFSSSHPAERGPGGALSQVWAILMDANASHRDLTGIQGRDKSGRGSRRGQSIILPHLDSEIRVALLRVPAAIAIPINNR